MFLYGKNPVEMPYCTNETLKSADVIPVDDKIIFNSNIVIKVDTVYEKIAVDCVLQFSNDSLYSMLICPKYNFDNKEKNAESLQSIYFEKYGTVYVEEEGKDQYIDQPKYWRSLSDDYWAAEDDYIKAHMKKWPYKNVVITTADVTRYFTRHYYSQYEFETVVENWKTSLDIAKCIVLHGDETKREQCTSLQKMDFIVYRDNHLHVKELMRIHEEEKTARQEQLKLEAEQARKDSLQQEANKAAYESQGL